jgi:peptidoglycan/xylan/chitin deacetylase (PgdA/CDA1 family)
MGRESSIIDHLLNLKKKSKSEKGQLKSLRYSTVQKMIMVLMCRKLGGEHKEIIKRIEKFGHEVNPHCWSHFQWSKKFERIDQEKEIEKAIASYRKILKKNPTGFAPPQWRYNARTIEILENKKIGYLSTPVETSPKNKNGRTRIIPLSYNKTIEELVAEGKKIEEIVKIYRQEFKKPYVNWYFHADYEGRGGIHYLEKILNITRGKSILYREMQSP